MIVFCDKSVPHTYGANPNDPWQIYWAHFSGSMAEYFTLKTGLAGLACTLKLNDMTAIMPYMETMLRHAKKATEDIHRISAFTALRMALLETISQITEISQQGYSPLINHSIQVMTSHLNDKLNLDQLSKTIGSSKYYFVRNFKNRVGQTPMYYYNYLKIKEAKILLISTDKSVFEIRKLFAIVHLFTFQKLSRNLQVFLQETIEINIRGNISSSSYPSIARHRYCLLQSF